MAEVGVLNLTIQDNSSKAAGGLRSLANALDRVKGSVGGLDLTKLSTQLANVRQAIADQKGASSTITKIAGLFNAINKYATGFGKANINTQPIVNLATAVQAIDTGKLREFTQIVSDFGTGATDKGLNNMSSAMQNVASSMERISNAVPKNDIGSEFRDIVRRNRDDQKSSLMKLNLQQFASGFDEALDSSDSPRVIIQSRVSKQVKETLDEYTDSVEKAKNANQALEDSEERIARLREENAKYVSKSKDSLKESNYGQYRQFFMLKGKEYEQWRQAARDTYGFEDKIFKENETYADALKAVEEAAKVASPAVEEVGKKAADANAKAGELIEKVTVPARVDNIGDHVDQALTSANEKATQLVERLSSPIDANKVAGSVEQAIQSVEEKTIDAFEIPALNEQSSIAGPFQSAGQEIEHYRELLAGAKQDLEFWNQTYEKTQKAIKYNGATEERTNMLWHSEEGFYKAIKAIEEYESYITKLEDHIRSVQGYKGAEAEFQKAIAGTMADTKFKFEPIDANTNNAQNLEKIENAAQGAGEALQRTAADAKRVKGAMVELADVAKSLGASFKGIIFGTGDLGKSMKNMFPTLSGLAKRFGSLIKYRMLRTVISHISKGFTEGVQNVYQYSKAVGTSLAPAMDSASSMLLQFKNSIGAAAAPLIQALIPVINQVVSVVITAINYLNQFFALLGGQATWTRALPQTTAAFDKQKKAAGGAGKAMKDLLADWDELNIIQSQSGGGGGGGGTSSVEDYASMFEEVSEYEGWLKSIGDILKNTFDDVYKTVALIGTAILGWKLSKAFNGALGKLGKLASGIAIEIVGIELSYNSGYSAGMKGGYDTGDIVGTIGGILATAIGGSLITSSLGLGGGVGFLVGIGVGVVANVVGYFKGLEKLKDIRKWGNVKLTPEQIEELVRSQFTFDVDAEINILNGIVNVQDEARKNVNKSISEFEESLNYAKVNVKLNVDKDLQAESVKQAADDAVEAINNINGYIDETGTSIKAMMEIMPLTSGEVSDKDFLDSITIHTSTLKDFFTDMGEKISGYILAGQKSGWANGEMEAAIALMESEQRIIAKAREMQKDFKLKESLKFNVDEVVKDGVIDKDSAEAVLNRQKETIDNYVKEAKEAASSVYDSLMEMSFYAEASATEALENGDTETYNRMHQNSINLANDAEKYLSEADERIEAKLKESKANIATYWKELLQTVYGEDITEKLGKATQTDVDYGGNWFSFALDELLAGGDHKTDYGRILSQSGTAEEIATELKKYLVGSLTGIGEMSSILYDANPTLFEDIFGEFFDNPMKFFTEDQKKTIFKSIYDAFDDFDYAKEIYSNLFPDVTEFPEIAEFIPASVASQEGQGIDIQDLVNIPEDGVEIPSHFEVEDWDPSSIFGDNVPEVDFSVEVDPSMSEPVTAPPIDSTAFTKTLDAMTKYTADSVATIQRYLDALNTLTSAASFFGIPMPVFPNVEQKASGGPVRSGDLVMANENGSFEMMGRMGNQPVVANNQQIVQGISSGVAQANGDVVGELRTLTGLMQRMLQKEFVAKAVPGSGWARMNDTSNAAYSNISGNA